MTRDVAIWVEQQRLNATQAVDYPDLTLRI